MKPFLFCLLSVFALLPAAAADDLSPLSDEFNDATTLTQWKRLYQVEGWGFDQLEIWDINQTNVGRMTMMPYSSTWYEEFRGVHVYKVVTGDFVVTTDVEPTNRQGNGPPGSAYSLGGIFVRTPRPITQGQTDWTPGHENFLFLSMGAANSPGTYQFEVKTTIDSRSTLEIQPGGPRGRIQVARLGSAFIMLRQIENGPWVVHRRYSRTDMPATLSVGLTTYTDFDTCAAVGTGFHNTHQLKSPLSLPGGGTRQCNPSLIARFDYVRYQRPVVPPALQGRNFANSASVSDAELLSFLGPNANHPYVAPPRLQLPTEVQAARIPIDGFPVRFAAPAAVGGTVEWSTNCIDWNALVIFAGTGSTFHLLDSEATNHMRRFYRVGLNQ